MGAGLVLLPTLAVVVLGGGIWQADREARREAAAVRQTLQQQRTDEFAAALGREADLFPEEPSERFALGLRHPELAEEPELDAECDDWVPLDAERVAPCGIEPRVHASAAHLASDDPDHDPRDFSFRLRSARQEAYLHLYVEVSDDAVVPVGRRIDEADHLRIVASVPDAGGVAVPERFVLALGAGGEVLPHAVTRRWRPGAGAPRGPWGRAQSAEYRRPAGAWRTTADGYALELRLPLRTLGPGWRAAELGLAVVDVDPSPAAASGLDRRRMWVVPEQVGSFADVAPDAAAFVRALAARDRADAEGLLAIFDARGRELLARVDEVATPDPELRALVRESVDATLRGESVQESPLGLTTAPITGRDGPLGIAVFRDEAHGSAPPISRVLLALPTTAAVVAAALLLLFLLLGYTRRLSARILALVEDVGAERDANDEIGALSRHLDEVVTRERAQRDYLEELPRILGHETLGPLGVVKMAIGELPGEDPRRAAAERAVGSIEELVEDLREATTLEEALERGEWITIDLVAFIREYAAADAEASSSPLDLRLPDEPVRLRVIERRIDQLLDKLIANARDFSDGSPVAVSVQRDGAQVRLRVENRGSQLPEGVGAEQLFAPMSSWRKRTTERHLGLGLYVVRLVAEQHGGEVNAENVGDEGVAFEVRLPL